MIVVLEVLALGKLMLIFSAEMGKYFFGCIKNMKIEKEQGKVVIGGI
jgi:hypothetical protein